MSTTSKEMLTDLAVEFVHNVSSVKFSEVDEHRTNDKAWVTITLPSREQFVITVEKC